VKKSGIRLPLPLSESDQEAMETLGFDLLAEVEALLRHAREYQREVQRLRGILGRGQTSTAERPVREAVRVHLENLRDACAKFGRTLDGIMEIGDDQPGERTRTRPSPKTNSQSRVRPRRTRS
jgi:uncharacterized membrane protein YccC